MTDIFHPHYIEEIPNVRREMYSKDTLIVLSMTRCLIFPS